MGEDPRWREIQERTRTGLPASSRVGGPVQDAAIEAAEAVVGAFPTIYRRLVSEFGWIDSPGFRVYGLGPTVPDELNVVVQTARERSEYTPGLGPFIALERDVVGNAYCVPVATAELGEVCPVYFADHEFADGGTTIQPYSEDFRDWLLELLKWANT